MRTALASLLAFWLLVPPAGAQQLLDSYHALLSWNDHYNSQGARLTQPWQVIQQDRANMHRFGRADPQDQRDGYFASPANRASAERMFLRGRVDPGVAAAIVNGEVMVHVEVWGQGGSGDFLTVTVR